MKKLIIFLGIFFLVVACSKEPKPNPWAQYTSQQLKGIPDAKLCKIITSNKYQPSQNLRTEMLRRGLKHCSPAEVACRKKVVKKGVGSYAQCQNL